MANIYYMQGFDIGQYKSEWVTGFNVGGLDDAGSEHFTGTPFWFSYVDGHQEGRAIYIGRWGGLGQRFYPGLEPRGMTICGSGWFRFYDQVGGPNTITNLFYFKRMVDGGISLWEDYYLTIHANGQMRVYHGGTPLGAVTLPRVSPWNCFQFYVNLPAGKVYVIVNGQVEEFDMPVDNRTGRWSVHYGGSSRNGNSGSVNFSHTMALDHLVISDTPLNTSGLQGVSIVASADRYEGVNSFKGALVIDGQTYHTYHYMPMVTSLAGYARGRNLVNSLSYIYPKNPATNQPWSDQDYTRVTSWGLCHHVFGLNPSNLYSSRLAAMALTWVEGTFEGPIIKVQAPGKAAYFSGPWTKTNPLLSFSGHVNTVPRSDEATFVEDATHLTINQEGCLLFEWQREELTPTSVVGITFAEERRTDYNEWRDILGDALPFKSFFITGYNVLGEGNKAFQSNYVTVNYVPVPFGSAYIQGLWDYSITGETGRWSSTQQIYSNSDVRYSNRMRKLKIRGQGNALQMRVTSEDGKPFSINGWTMSASSNASV